MLKSGRIFIIILLTFLISGMLFSVYAAAKEADEGGFRYVREARLVRGKTEQEAAAWLTENGFEPVLPSDQEEVLKEEPPESGVLVLGIKRTADAKEAIADFGIDVWSSSEVTTVTKPDEDEWVALFSVSQEGASKPILADSIVVRYGEGEMPEGSTKKLHLTSMMASTSEDTSDQGLYLFWNVDKEPADALPASSFSDGWVMLAASTGLMLGIIGTTCFLLPQKRKEEAKREAEKQEKLENKWWY